MTRAYGTAPKRPNHLLLRNMHGPTICNLCCELRDLPPLTKEKMLRCDEHR